MNSQEYPKCLYHPKLAPQGKVFQSAAETTGLQKKGWVDNPGKFPEPPWFVTSLRAIKPWWTEWDWAFKAAAVILGFIAATVVVYKAFRH